jgi:hypothetical protein
MSTEEQTRTEVIKSLIASNNALILLLQERASTDEATKVIAKLQSGENPGIPEHAVDTPTIKEIKARRRKERPEPQPEPLGPPLSSEHEMNRPTEMADIKPTKPGKTLADLRVALQDCITKHGMPGAKERLAPFAKVSDVPDAEIDATIKRLLA